MLQSKYNLVADYIRQRIESGSLPHGHIVPSENELSKKFDVSRDTVRKALEQLEEENLIERKRGSGTYVKETKKKAANRIAVVTTYVDSYIFPKIITGIEEVLSEKGYAMQLSFSNNRFDREREVLMDILEHGDVAGIIMEPVKSALPNPNIDCYVALQRKGIEVLLINSYYQDIYLPHVSLNDANAAKLATEYLISKGHRKIGAFLKMDDGQGRFRFAGYKKALMNAGINSSEELIVWFDTAHMQHIGNIADNIRERLFGCTAVLCYNDLAANELVSYLLKCGMKIPEDVSIISIDDSTLAELCDVKLTSCTHPKEQLGRKAAESLLHLLSNPRFNASYEFDTKIIERDSVKDVRNDKGNTTRERGHLS